MADDTQQTASDIISTDHVSTLNGAAITPSSSTPKVQRVKVCYGDDNTSRDVSASFPLPITGTVQGIAGGTPQQMAGVDGQKATYTANINGLATNAAIDLCALIGSGSKTIRVTRVEIELLVTTASTALNADLRLIKRTTAGTPGTAAGTSVIGPQDTNDAAATATASGYSTAGTPGTQAAIPRAGKVPWAVGRYNFTFDLGRMGRAVVLRGTGEKLTVNQSAALTGGVFQWAITYEFTEE